MTGECANAVDSARDSCALGIFGTAGSKRRSNGDMCSFVQAVGAR